MHYSILLNDNSPIALICVDVDVDVDVDVNVDVDSPVLFDRDFWLQRVKSTSPGCDASDARTAAIPAANRVTKNLFPPSSIAVNPFIYFLIENLRMR